MHGTLQDWHDIYSRELAECPPVDDFARMYFTGNKWWSPPDLQDGERGPAGGSADDEIWECPFPDVTE